ncbi:MAG: hypothetical protein ABWY16_03425 [Pedobacter sp.]|uniref:hypothetical protein n=1 Tax=Pedobacter sp. TaxID=1411316 RepID=UPI003396B425
MENQNQDYGNNGSIDVEETKQQVQPLQDSPVATPDTFSEEDLNTDTDDIGTADVDGLLEEVDDRADLVDGDDDPEDDDPEDDGTEEFDDLPTDPGNGDEDDDDLIDDDDDLGLDDDSLPTETDGDDLDLDDDDLDIEDDDALDLDDDDLDDDDDDFLK